MNNEKLIISVNFRFDENIFIIFGSTKALPYRPQTIKFVYARLLLQSRYGSTAPSRREPIGISVSVWIEAESNTSISLPFKGRSPSNGETSAKLTEGAARKRGNPSEPKFAMRLTEGVIFLMNSEVALLMNNEKWIISVDFRFDENLFYYIRVIEGANPYEYVRFSQYVRFFIVFTVVENIIFPIVSNLICTPLKHTK